MTAIEIILYIISSYGWLSLGAMIGYVFAGLLSNIKEV